MARATKKAAVDAAIFWLEIFTCSSSEFNSGSLNISHHFPWSVASAGCAGFQPRSCDVSGVSSLNAGGV